MILRLVRPGDNQQLSKIIRSVMTDFGAVGAGFSIQDAEVDDMFGAYQIPRGNYFVVAKDDAVFGGAGIAPLLGGDPEVCELKKMYFVPEIRGQGWGQKLIDVCLESARRHGFKLCYLETLKSMTAAQYLYLKNDFEPISRPLGKTGHFGCDAWFVKSL